MNPNLDSKGAEILVEPANNLPADSLIGFWVMQDGWQDNSYGFPIYKDTDYVLVS